MGENCRVLVMGGTGAMGFYVVPDLAREGLEVTATSRSPRVSDSDSIHYRQGDARDLSWISGILNEGWDCIIDFMVYSTKEFSERYSLLLEHTRHYIFLSTYRVFADCPVITEDSPRLLDVSNDIKYLSTDEYALTKARQENILQASGFTNWTIIRPTITYSRNRFQLTIFEAGMVFARAKSQLAVALPDELLNKKTTMTWAGDVSKMICGLVRKPSAFGEAFNVCTSESRTWQEISDIYSETIGLEIAPCTMEQFVYITGKDDAQLKYDRMFNRVMDNKKILKVTGLSQEDLMSVSDGLHRELAHYPNIAIGKGFGRNTTQNARMDRVLHTKTPLSGLSLQDKVLYYSGIYPLLSFGLRVFHFGVRRLSSFFRLLRLKSRSQR